MKSRATIKLPPPHLRERVSCTPDIREYLVVGSRTASSIGNFLAAAGYDLAGFDRILDFACGCARTLNFIKEKVDTKKLHGCDYDDELTAWCRRNLDLKDCITNRSKPPLDWPAGYFDLIYAISFLTHVDEKAQLAWLAEWKRILRPDGLILVSLLGESAAQSQGVKIPAGRCHYRDGGKKFNEKVCHHSRSYVYERWGGDFSILAYSERGLNDHQDMVLMGQLEIPRTKTTAPYPPPLPAELAEVWRRRGDLQRNFDQRGIGLSSSYWRNLTLRDWAFFHGCKEEASLQPFSFEARYEVLEAS